MSSARELTKHNFDEVTGKGVTLVDFWAEWCGPCRMMSPAIDELAKEYADKATIAKVNVDNENDLARKFEVSSIPTLLVLKDGAVAKQFIGVTSKTDLAKAIDEALA
ncbi:MAG: thioredoxin [Candidatus Hydrogenedentales bacterium]|jgi:thioredoxin 1